MAETYTVWNQSVGFWLKHFCLSTCFMQEDMACDMECYLNGHGRKKREESDLKFRLYHVVDDC